MKGTQGEIRCLWEKNIQPMLKFAHLVSIFMLIGFLVGCGKGSQTSNSTGIPFPSVTVAEEATRTPLPTATRRPSATPSVIPTINVASTIIYQKELTAYANANATYFMQETLVPRFTRICEDLYSPRKISPNGLWLVEFCYSPNYQDLIMIFSKIDTLVWWKLSYTDYIPQMDFVPDGGLSVIHWSNDERYVYFLSHLGGDGGECFYQPSDRGAGLFRLDLQSGWITTVLRPNNEFWWYSFSFSPTDRRLVYGEQSRDLKFLDLTNGNISSITSEESNYETGGYLWSSDGLQLVYSALTRHASGERGSYSLRLVDVQSGSEQILLEASDICFSALTWETTGALIVEREGSEGKTIIVIGPFATPSP